MQKTDQYNKDKINLLRPTYVYNNKNLLNVREDADDKAKRNFKPLFNISKVSALPIFRIQKYDSIITSLRSRIRLARNMLKRREADVSCSNSLNNIYRNIYNNDIYNNNINNININNINNNNNESNNSKNSNTNINSSSTLSQTVNEIKHYFSRCVLAAQKFAQTEQDIYKINMKIFEYKKKNFLGVERYEILLREKEAEFERVKKEKEELRREKRRIHSIIYNEIKNDSQNQYLTGNGKVLMSIYKYYTNLIENIISENRNKIQQLKLLRKSSEISVLEAQIKIRDEWICRARKQKGIILGNDYLSSNLSAILPLSELSLFRANCDEEKKKKKKQKVNYNIRKSMDNIRKNDEYVEYKSELPGLFGIKEIKGKSPKLLIPKQNNSFTARKRSGILSSLRRSIKTSNRTQRERGQYSFSLQKLYRKNMFSRYRSSPYIPYLNK